MCVEYTRFFHLKLIKVTIIVTVIVVVIIVTRFNIHLPLANPDTR
jgi:hypothetical protein